MACSVWIIFTTDSFRATSHAIKTIIAIISAEKYSILPCQYGCSLSGLLFDNFVPTIVMTEESTSLKLFKASKMIAIEFDTNQTIALKITKTIFVVFFTIFLQPVICHINILNTALITTATPMFW